MPSRRKLLRAIGLARFGREAERGELTAPVERVIGIPPTSRGGPADRKEFVITGSSTLSPALFARDLAIDFADFRCVPIASLLHEFYIGHLE